MNRWRRKQLQDILDKVCDLRSDLEAIMEEEQDSYDNMPENLQCSERGEQSEHAIETMEYAINSFDEIEGYIEEAME